jgi:hypothetical protein
MIGEGAGIVDERVGGTPTEDASDLWRFASALESAATQIDGYALEATDGFIGTVGVARSDAAVSYLIALGGPWNGGLTVMIPAGLVKGIDTATRVVRLRGSREQIRNAPPYENDRYQDAAYRSEVSAYYARLEPGLRLLGLEAARRAVALARTHSVAFGTGAAG